MYAPKLGPYNAMALGIASELAEFCCLGRAGSLARLQHFWVCRLVGMVARHNLPSDFAKLQPLHITFSQTCTVSNFLTATRTNSTNCHLLIQIRKVLGSR